MTGTNDKCAQKKAPAKLRVNVGCAAISRVHVSCGGQVAEVLPCRAYEQ